MADSSHALELRNGQTLDCAVSIYSSRESKQVLGRCVERALRSAAGRRACVDVIVNGNEGLARAVAADLEMARSLPDGVGLRVWSVALGDKALAWNQYVHLLAPPAISYAFVDGYVGLDESSVALLTEGLWHSGAALAATGVPRVGRTARKIREDFLRDGGMHGNFFALKSTAVAEIRRTGFRLPLGIYRTDSTLGAALSFGLNLFPREWNPKARIAVVPEASWDLTPKAWWRPSDVRTHFKRVLRQARGALENAAVRDSFAIRDLPFESLPRTASEMILRWMAASPEQASEVQRRYPLARFAMKEIRQPRDWSGVDLPPNLVLDWSAVAMGSY